MDIYASDEEKGEQIKQWWRDNGSSVLVACALSLAVIFGVRYWFSHQQSVAEYASHLYQKVVSNVSQDKISEADASTKVLITEYSGTPYAVFSALEMAEKFALTDVDVSKSYYKWVIEHAELTGHVEIARLRLARLLASNSDYDGAFALIEQSTSNSFESLFLELKGDIYIAQNEVKEAHTAYQAALMKLAQGEPRQQLLKLKLDDTAFNSEG